LGNEEVKNPKIKPPGDQPEVFPAQINFAKWNNTGMPKAGIPGI